MSSKSAATAKSTKQQSGFNKWYNSQAGQRTVGIVYSLGAAVVIIGALFKIQHWPGASVILTLGMCTEAFLFTIGVFEKPHPNYQWNKVFPVLLGDEESAGIDVTKGGAFGNGGNASNFGDLNVDEKLEE
ncbi:MAG: gliding motility protein GldL, partial [Bacteroidales bacterium]|nr:gliding motility protein GldL [Bacteroidales bacterium]